MTGVYLPLRFDSSYDSCGRLEKDIQAIRKCVFQSSESHLKDYLRKQDHVSCILKKSNNMFSFFLNNKK